MRFKTANTYVLFLTG
nr:unnamed protein product [Callosobruchus analis]